MKKLFTLSILLSVGLLSLAQSARYMELNNVRAMYHNRGQLFWDLVGLPKYEVPKNSGKTSIFAAGLWLSAKDENQDIHCAVSKYNTDGGYDFQPGPLKVSGLEQGTTTETEASSYNRIWSVSKLFIDYHISNFESSNYVIPEDILTWPAHGNVGQDYAQNLAPFIDVNENGIYEPSLGDYPDIKGDMSLYWIFNDNLGSHEESGESTPLQVEIHAQAYTYVCSMDEQNTEVLNYSSFLEYRIINRSPHTYPDFSMGLFTDGDIGNGFDDYIGTHVGLNSLYFYNGDDMDGTGIDHEYGANPPAQFITILDAPFAVENDYIDNDNDGTIDEEGEKCLLGRTVYFEGNGALAMPSLDLEHNNYMEGYWRDGRRITFGGDAYQPVGGTFTKYVYPGTSDPWDNGTWGESMDYNLEGGWTEANEEHEPGDRKGLAISGPFNFVPNQELKFDIALVWSRGEDGAMSSVNKGFSDVARIIEMYQDGTISSCGDDNTAVKEVNAPEDIEIYPNPVIDVFVVNGAEKNSKFELLNLKGQLVMQGSIKNETIDIKILPKGTYLLKVIQKNESKTLKIVKI